MTPTEELYCEVADGVATITIDRPPVNAFSTPLWSALGELLGRIGSDDEIRVAILTASGRRAFSAGADVRELRSLDASTRSERNLFVLERMREIASVPVPLIAAINGPAVGGAVNLVTLCDVRIAAESASFSLPEIDRGTVGGGGTFLRRIGVREGVLRELLFTGRRVPAAEALVLGLVNHVVPDDALMATALELAHVMAAKSRQALVMMKAALRATEVEVDWVSAYRRTSEHSESLAESADAKDRIARFLEGT